MKTTEKKAEFIILRAEGESYRTIAQRLHISKSTCSNWEKELQDNITEAKEERLQDLFSLYRIGKEAYIEKLGETLKKIDAAIEEADLTAVPPEKLLKLKLDYEDRLKAEYKEPAEEEPESFREYTQEEMLEAVGALYEKVKKGSITAAQTRAELATLEGMQKAINAKESFW